MNRWRVKVLWEPRDLWIGLYWDRKPTELHFYLCLIPCLPLHVWRLEAA